MGVTVLVVGSGGREHALAWKLSQSPRVGRVVVAPGNGGWPDTLPLAASDPAAVVEAARSLGASLVVVGPEDPLAAGVVDALEAAGIPAFGPVAACARLEASKAFSKAVMDEVGVPTARWGRFTTLADALSFLDAAPFQVVVKASGLCAGKGVVVCDDRADAVAAVSDMMEAARFGLAGAEVVVEERLEGEEASLLAFCDGERYAVMPAAQDHKRVGEGDTGPNTGGMGAYAPAPVAAGREVELAELSIAPVLAAMRRAGTPFRGVLYAGLMLTPDGPRVLEYNARFGDPETEVLLPLLDGDLYEIALACAQGRLDPASVRWRDAVAATVICAAAGYPEKPRKGDPITLGAMPEGVTAFHAGTSRQGDELRTSGGRVLAVTGVGDTLRGALSAAYAGVAQVEFDGMHVRRDIGHRALRGPLSPQEQP
jgi:phosphoribosylamine--glycine ligase